MMKKGLSNVSVSSSYSGSTQSESYSAPILSGSTHASVMVGNSSNGKVEGGRIKQVIIITKSLKLYWRHNFKRNLIHKSLWIKGIKAFTVIH